MRFYSIIQGVGGEPEISRTIGAFGSAVFIISVPIFTVWNMLAGRAFDVTAFCIAYPAGISAVVSATALAVAVKDKGVAAAQATNAATAAQVQP